MLGGGGGTLECHRHTPSTASSVYPFLYVKVWEGQSPANTSTYLLGLLLHSKLSAQLYVEVRSHYVKRNQEAQAGSQALALINSDTLDKLVDFARSHFPHVEE